MEAGLIASVEVFEAFASFTGATVDNGTELIGAGILSRVQSTYTPDASLQNSGIVVAVYATKGGSGPIASTETVYRLVIEDLGIDETYTVASFTDEATTRVELLNLKLYARSNYWELMFDQIDWYTESTLRYSNDNGGSGFSLTSDAGMLTPASIPLLGIPFELAPVPMIDLAVPL